MTEDAGRGGVPLGSFTGLLDPRQPTPKPMDFRSGPGPTPPGAAGPVGFRTFTESELAKNWPPDMSGARGGDVVLMSGNLWLKLSVDGGKTFTDLDFTKIFAADTVYGGWAGDQVIHYIPAIDCFVLYVQSFKGTGTQANRNVVKIAHREPGRPQEVLGWQAGVVGGNGTSRRIRSGSARHGWIFPTSPTARISCTSTPTSSSARRASCSSNCRSATWSRGKA